MKIKISPQWVTFLSTLATAVAGPAAGLVGPAVAGYLRLASMLISLPGTTDAEVEALTAKVQAMVDEKRGPTDAEISEIEDRIRSQSAEIQSLRPQRGEPGH